MKVNLFTAIAMAFLMLISRSSFGQTTADYTKGMTDLISWFSSIDNVLMRISDKEKIKRIYRQLGYASEDIDNIAFNKQLLVDEILKVLSTKDRSALYELEPRILEIEKDIDMLLKRLRGIKADLSLTDQTTLETIIQKIKGGMYSKGIYLNEITRYINGENIPIEKVKKDALQAKKIADEAELAIKEVKVKIKNKLNE